MSKVVLMICAWVVVALAAYFVTRTKKPAKPKEKKFALICSCGVDVLRNQFTDWRYTKGLCVYTCGACGREIETTRKRPYHLTDKKRG